MPEKFNVTEFECSNFPMIIKIPLLKYDQSEEPWMADKTYMDVDNFGSNWNPSQ